MSCLDLSHRLTAAALFLALAACSSDDSGPSSPPLTGTWGSRDAEFVAIQAGAEMRAGCSTIVIRTPVTLTDANTFTSRGELHGSGAMIGELPSVTVTGAVSGSRLSLSAPSEAGGSPVSYLLEAGVARPAAETPECPQ